MHRKTLLRCPIWHNIISLYAKKYVQRYNKIMIFANYFPPFPMQISYLQTPAKILIIEICKP